MDTNLEDMTVAQLFSVSEGNTAEIEAKLDAGDFAGLLQRAKGEGKPVKWNVLGGELAGSVGDALQTDLLGGWIVAWRKAGEVREAAEKSRSQPGTEVPYVLPKHSIDSTFRPCVKVMLDGVTLQSIEFEVTVTTQIETATLILKDGYLAAIEPGKIAWSGSIALEHQTLIERKLTELSVGHRIGLKHPIALT